jgi:hypothetical protein
MRLHPPLFTLALSILAACSGRVAATEPATTTDTPAGAAELRAVSERSGVRVSNATDRAIYYTVFESEFATVASLAPCTEPARCPSVPPGGEVVVPLSAVAGYHPGAREGIVYWWHLVPGADGRFSMDSLRTVRVRF